MLLGYFRNTFPRSKMNNASWFTYRWLLTFDIYFLKPKLNIPIDKNNATQGPVFLDENKDDQL